MRNVSKLDKAKAAIVLDNPFFASILLRRPMVAREDIPLFAINQRGTIYYNPKNIEALPVPQIVWGLCHECMHYMGQHAARQQARKHKKWNYATDYFINDTLTSAKVGEPIPATLQMDGAKDKSCEAIYDEMPDNDDNGSGQGDGQGDGGNQGGMGDDILQEGTPMTESEIKEQAAQTKIEIAEAAQAAKMRGKLPAALAEYAADVLDAKTPWHDILERFMVGMTNMDSTWARPNRRFIPSGVYLPSMAKQPTMGELVVQIDVSGSISKQELAYYNGHLKRIVSQCNPEKVHAIYVDTQVQKHVVFEQGEEVDLEFYSGGGTHMPAGFDWVEEEGIEPDAVVVLTDGYTGWGEQPDFPVIWCISSDVQAPYGENVHFEMEH
ncbi:VWA-like domain-containing protein [Paraburkholderia sp. BL10I2N1]|uniref:vWA domain-containing protein n=1 Tax=Paraburkholderia sp. BL10I2N1 TaxID=1938796 RepID=UPI00105E19A7|nr:VWA-like domain-containing protein [Paraburkholderia sp. BL10I2N1]TDN70461.1 putative metal-dependent peptidase [Paraburkholderia sp. BL10I2N1]